MQSQSRVDSESENNPRRLSTTSVRQILPGLSWALAITAVATLLGHFVPIVGAPVFAILIGILIAAVVRPGERLLKGINFTARYVLQASIVVLGFNLSISQVLHTSVTSLPTLLGTLVMALTMAYFVGKRLGLGRDVNTLIGVGTAICGASAIAATDAVIGAAEIDVVYAIATIFTFNIVSVLLYPTLGHLLGLSQHAFGLWSGTAINDTSSVVAAASIYGHAATSYGVVVKLTRTLAIIPITMFLAFLRSRRAKVDPSGAPQASGTRASSFRLSKALPPFILIFVLAVVVNTVGLIPSGSHGQLSNLATIMITAALAAIGLSTRLRDMRIAGPRPLLLGAILWATVGISSLSIQAVTGTLH